jgi:hypothetical protein
LALPLRKESYMRMMRRTLLLGALVVGALTALTGTAGAQTARGFEMFAGCQNDPAVTTCFRADTRGGHLQIGSTDTPITSTQSVSAGFDEFGNLRFNSRGGMLGDPLSVPGGLAGLTGIPEIIINILTLGANRVYAKPEIVGQAVLSENLLLPIRVLLRNPFIIPGCAIGSRTNPMTLNLTTGTTAPPPPNRPITGRSTDFRVSPRNPLIFEQIDEKFVDNAFAAPTAAGCDLLGFGLISGLINSRVGLPSAAGRNEAIFDHTDVFIASKADVYP